MSSVAILSLSIFLISEEEIKLKLFLSTVIGIIEDLNKFRAFKYSRPKMLLDLHKSANFLPNKSAITNS